MNNQQKAINRLFVARRINADSAAWIKSAPITAQLSELTAIKTGSLTISVNGTEKEVVNLDFSTAKSFSDVATELASAVGAVSGAFNSVQNAIILTTTETGDTASISFATKATTGTDVSALLGLTEDFRRRSLSRFRCSDTCSEHESCDFCFLATGSDSQPCMQQRLLRLPL